MGIRTQEFVQSLVSLVVVADQGTRASLIDLTGHVPGSYVIRSMHRRVLDAEAHDVVTDVALRIVRPRRW